MLQALYICLIYAPCIPLSSSQELFPDEFTDVFLKKTPLSRSTWHSGQHHMWCTHSRWYTNRPTNCLTQDGKENSVFAMPFFSYTCGYFVYLLNKLTMASLLLMSHDEVTRARKTLCVCVKSTRLKIRQNTTFFILPETSHVLEDV